MCGTFTTFRSSLVSFQPCLPHDPSHLARHPVTAPPSPDIIPYNAAAIHTWDQSTGHQAHGAERAPPRSLPSASSLPKRRRCRDPPSPVSQRKTGVLRARRAPLLRPSCCLENFPRRPSQNPPTSVNPRRCVCCWGWCRILNRARRHHRCGASPWVAHSLLPSARIAARVAAHVGPNPRVSSRRICGSVLSPRVQQPCRCCSRSTRCTQG